MQKQHLERLDTCITFCKTARLSETYETRPKVSSTRVHTSANCKIFERRERIEEHDICFLENYVFSNGYNLMYRLGARY